MPGTPFDALFHAYALKTGVPQALIEATARTESSLNPNSVVPESGGRHSYGLFNILDSTARGLGFSGDFAELLDPETNTNLATSYMQGIIQRQGGLSKLNLNDFYSEYNSGKRSLWQTSEEVFAHVQNFLANYARSVTAGDTSGVWVLVIALGLLAKYLKKK